MASASSAPYSRHRNQISVVAADLLVAAGAECLAARPGEDDRADLEVVASAREGVAQLGEGLGAEGVSPLGAVYRDLGQPVVLLEQDVAVLGSALPADR